MNWNVFAALAVVGTCHGVIVAGANGGEGTSNNTNAAQLDAAVGTPFPYFDNVITYSDSSGVYLGYDPDTLDVWVMSAKHVTTTVAGSSLVIDGETYQQQGAEIGIAGADLKLIRYHHASDLVPSFSAVPLATTSPTINTEIVMIGLGVDRNEGPAMGPNDDDSVTVSGGTGAGYTWRSNSGSNQLKRWGTNNVDTNPFVFTAGTIGWFADFDMPALGEWETSNEAAMAVRDSGSGAFFLDGGEWVLGGSASAVTTPNETAFTDPGDPEGSFYTDVAIFESSLSSTIGATLVPEPSVLLLILAAVPGIVRRRR